MKHANHIKNKTKKSATNMHFQNNAIKLEDLSLFFHFLLSGITIKINFCDLGELILITPPAPFPFGMQTAISTASDKNEDCPSLPTSDLKLSDCGHNLSACLEHPLVFKNSTLSITPLLSLSYSS